MFEFDSLWANQAALMDVRYSRYADDLYFSTNKPEVLRQIFRTVQESLDKAAGPRLNINTRKTSFSSRKYRRLTAGLVLTPQRTISIGRTKKRLLKGLVNRLRYNQLTLTEVHSLRGWVAYVRSTEPSFIAALERKYQIDLEHESTWKPSEFNLAIRFVCAVGHLLVMVRLL